MTKTNNPEHRITTSDLLDAYSCRNTAAAVERQNDSEMVIAIPLKMKWYMKRPFRLVFPFSTVKRVALDALGMEVWRHCDGVRKSEEIIETFAQRHQLTFHEARLSVMNFFNLLTQRGMLVMVGTSDKRGMR